LFYNIINENNCCLGKKEDRRRRGGGGENQQLITINKVERKLITSLRSLEANF
jgi:hypothetical protein